MRATELIYFAGCPHIAAAREQLGRALAEANLAPVWVEYQTDDPGLPDYARGFGSPTILVDGKDVAGSSPGECADSCRLYRDESGRQVGVPPFQIILAALRASMIHHA
ncbi:MAG: hypothetical protein ABI609_01370 [Acidobacteriota bacterium]